MRRTKKYLSSAISIIAIIIIFTLLVSFLSYLGKSRGGNTSTFIDFSILESKNGADIHLFERKDGNRMLSNTGETDLHNFRIISDVEHIRLYSEKSNLHPPDKFLTPDEWGMGEVFELDIGMTFDIEDCPEILSRNYYFLTDDMIVDCRETYILESDELGAKLAITTRRWNDHYGRDVLGCDDLLTYMIPFMCSGI